MGKKKRGGRQAVSILAESNSVVNDSLDTGIGYTASPDTVEAWLLDMTQQALDEKTGDRVQVLSERSMEPVIVFDIENAQEIRKRYKRDISKIASQQEDEEISYMEQKKRGINRTLIFGIITALFALTISIVVLVNL